MCAIVNSSLLLLFLIFCYLNVSTVGLPYRRRQERGSYEDILSGEDFLSMFMKSTYPQMYRHQDYRNYQETTPTYESTFALEDALRSLGIEVDYYSNDDGGYSRGSRSTSYISTPSLNRRNYKTYASKQRYYNQDTINFDNTKPPLSNIDDNTQKDKIIMPATVSSNAEQPNRNMLEMTTETEPTTETTTIMPPPTDKPSIIMSEERPSIVGESSKSEFSIDEGEPITKNTDSPLEQFNSEYSASVQALPSPHSISSFRTSDDYVSQQHHTVIYHDNPQENGQARSVSYSTVIQAVPNQQPLPNWNDDKLSHHERQERHYDGTQVAYENNLNKYQDSRTKMIGSFKILQNATQVKDMIKQTSPINSMAETKDYFVTSKYNLPEFNDSGDKKLVKNENTWDKQELYNNPSEATSRKATDGVVVHNWQVQQKPFVTSDSKRNPQIPVIYGQPEQNYEIDESVSIVTNGRTHGVQRVNVNNHQKPPVETKTVQQQRPTKVDDNQKVGYVVEGRNYRKYRVEERTSDGFIVGEYGVVSHDDGSLRGVRYTADGTINPRLIYDALMKFLSL